MPTLLDLLRWHQTEVERERQNKPETRGRPFSRLFSPAKLPRRPSSDCEMEGVAKLRESGDSDAGASYNGMKHLPRYHWPLIGQAGSRDLNTGL